MYVYYDRAGNLKEIINEPVRSGDLYSKDILVYWDNHPSVNTFNAKVRTSDGTVENVELIPSQEVTLTIPYNQDRDLKFFKYNTPYSFFKYTPATTFPSGQTEVAFYFQYGGELSDEVLTNYRVVVLQILPFYVEETNDLTLGDNINQTQWSCLLNSLKMNNVRAYEDVPSSVELDNLGANSLIFNYGDNCVYKVILDPTYTPVSTDIEVDPYVLQLVAIMTPVSSEHPISADLVDDTDSVHKFVTAQDLDMIGKIPESFYTTGSGKDAPILTSSADITNTSSSVLGYAHRNNSVYINTLTGYVYAPKFYQNGVEVQDKLVSGSNIKTINGVSVLGSGDMTVTASAAWGSITGDITSQTDLQNALSGKQNTLVSGTNIKTINNTSVLGSGNVSVQPVVDATHPINADYVDTTDSTNKFVTASDITTWNGKQNALTFDTTPTQNSTNPVTSGGVYAAINSAISGVYTYRGTETPTEINQFIIADLNTGDVYNIDEDGTITLGDSNLPVKAGDNIVWDSASNRFEMLTGIVDLSGYQTLLSATNKLNPAYIATDSSNRFVTDSEKTTWSGKQNALTTQTAYTSQGSATKVPQITTNNLGQVTGITEVTITQPTVNNATLTITQNGVSKGTFTANASSDNTIALTDTTYTSQSAASGGTAVSLVTTGEKYTWNNKSTVSVSDTGTATDEVSYITINGTEKKLAGGYSFDTDANVISLVDDIFLDYPISVSVTNGTYTGASRIKKLGTATIVVSASSGYTLPDSITVSGASYTYSNGTITLSEPTGDVSVSVVCRASSYTVELTNSYGGYMNDAGVKYSTDGGTTWNNLGSRGNTSTTITLSNITQLQVTYQSSAVVMGSVYGYNGSSWVEISSAYITYDLTPYLGTYQKFSAQFDT